MATSWIILFMLFARLVLRTNCDKKKGRSSAHLYPLISSFLMSRRSQSFRQGPLHTSKRSQSQNAVNTSISAHPLLPIETGLYYFLLFIIQPLLFHFYHLLLDANIVSIIRRWPNHNFSLPAQTAEWEARKQSLESKTPSQMKKEADMETRQSEIHTQYSRPQVTAAQVETYQMTKTSEDHRRPSQQLDSSLSVSPTATTPQRSIISNAHEVGRVHALPDDRNLVNSGECPELKAFHVFFPFEFEVLRCVHKSVSMRITDGNWNNFFLFSPLCFLYIYLQFMSDH